jgi:hypothetical protein
MSEFFFLKGENIKGEKSEGIGIDFWVPSRFKNTISALG